MNATYMQVRATFEHMHDIRASFEPQARMVPAASVRVIKRRLRKLVYQEQRQFVQQVEALGFKLAWCLKENGYVVYDPAISAESVDVYTALLSEGGEEIDVLARSHEEARKLAEESIKLWYMPECKVERTILRARGCLFM